MRQSGSPDELVSGQVEALSSTFLALTNQKAPSPLIETWQQRLRAGDNLAEILMQVLQSPGNPNRRPDPRHVINLVYELVVHRYPAEVEVAEWARFLEGGLTYWAFLLAMVRGVEGQTQCSIDEPLNETEAEEFASSISAAYLLILGRKPACVEVDHWRTELTDDAGFLRMLEGLKLSPEGEARNLDKMRENISMAFNSCLYREPDAAELDDWSRRVSLGAPLSDLIQSILASPPAKHARAARRVDLELRRRALVSAVYEITVKRKPSDDEISEWSGFLARGLEEGELLLKMAFSEEALSHSTYDVGDQASPEDRLAMSISTVFGLVLRRPAEDKELRFWTPRLEAGWPFSELISSVEAQALNASASHGGLLGETTFAVDHSLEAEASGYADCVSASLNSPSTRSARVQLVHAVYQLTVRRAPIQSETDQWLTQLSDGLSDLDFVIGMARSEEARAKRLPLPEETKSQDDQLSSGISLVYWLVCGRPASDGETEVWRARLHADHNFLDLIIMLKAGEEAQDRQEQPLRSTIDLLYRVCLNRNCADPEIDIWLGHIRSGMSIDELLHALYNSAEAAERRDALRLNPELKNPDFVQAVYQIVLGRGAAAFEIQHWTDALAAGPSTRESLLRDLFTQQARRLTGPPASVDSSHCWVMGTNKTITGADWISLGETAPEQRNFSKRFSYRGRFHMRPQSVAKPKISAIASLYNGKAFIRQFLDNITSQSVFTDCCELIIVDANSPEDEYAEIAPFLSRFPNIIYRRIDYRIGIYDAWNIGVEMARGEYITNTNLDDLRRMDSLELQAACLDELDFVDVVYQDFFYTLEWDLTFSAIAAMNVRSNLPLVTRQNILLYNSPHNAPMWRRKLHDDIGLFDISYKSAGDFDFWLRCAAAGKNFYKLNDPHVAYFHNPQGLSTQAETRGIDEANRAMRKHSKELLKHITFDPTRRATALGLDIDTLRTHLSRVTEYDVVQAALVQLASGSQETNAI